MVSIIKMHNNIASEYTVHAVQYASLKCFSRHDVPTVRSNLVDCGQRKDKI